MLCYLQGVCLFHDSKKNITHIRATLCFCSMNIFGTKSQLTKNKGQHDVGTLDAH